MSSKAELLAVAVMIALTVVLIPWMPARLAWHFDVGGHPDVWLPKPVALSTAPFVACLFVTLGSYWSRTVRARREVVLWGLLLAHAAVCAYGLGLGRLSLIPFPVCWGALAILRGAQGALRGPAAPNGAGTC